LSDIGWFIWQYCIIIIKKPEAYIWAFIFENYTYGNKFTSGLLFVVALLFGYYVNKYLSVPTYTCK